MRLDLLKVVRGVYRISETPIVVDIVPKPLLVTQVGDDAYVAGHGLSGDDLAGLLLLGIVGPCFLDFPFASCLF